MNDGNSNFERLVKYRYIQVAANLCNEIQQRVLVPIMLGGSTVVAGVSLAIFVITPRTSENLLVLVMMGFTYVDTALFMTFGIREFAVIHEFSKKVETKVKASLNSIFRITERKWTMRYVRTMRAIKMKFGGNNFVEKQTPFQCLSHAMQISVQTLLFDRNQ